MENLKTIQGLETVLNALLSLLNTLIAISKFLFLTPWGWLILAFSLFLIIIYKARKRRVQ